MIALLLALQVAAGGGQPGSRVDVLWDWLTLVQEHEPGSIDEPAQRVASWNPEELERVLQDVPWLFTLVRDPGAPLPLATIDTQRSNRRRVRGYSTGDADALRVLARAVARQNLDPNTLLRRGAMLHTDLALAGPPRSGPRDQAGGGPLRQTTLRVDDGRQSGVEDSVGHWATARGLLDLVMTPARRDRPSPGSDPMVRLWYRASLAIMQITESLHVQHVEQAVLLFPRDPHILFLAGAHHEALASPRFQATLRAARLPAGVSFRVRSSGDELRSAEQLFTQALEIDPSLVEARIRLGRALTLRGRAGEAVEQLQRAASATADPLLSYYAQLFLGRALDVAGERDRARLAYEAAAALYPLAQSPRLALGQLAADRGNAAAARAAIEDLVSTPAGDRVDPWWSYYVAAGRDAEMLLLDVASMVAQGTP